MLSVKDKGRLILIINHCERIKEKVYEISQEEFNTNIDLRDIVCFNLFQIGELVKGLSQEFTSTYSEMPWKQIKGMRDRIGHGYETIDAIIVYNTAQTDIKLLKDYCNDILMKEENLF